MPIKNIRSRGDTLVEVLFAITVFSLVVVGSISIMNQGTATAQRAFEMTLVRQEIDAQAETLRYLNTAYLTAFRGSTVDYGNSAAGAWQDMSQYIASKAGVTLSELSTGGACQKAPEHSFILDTQSATYVHDPAKMTLADVFAQVEGTGSSLKAKGIWIEGVSGAAQQGIGYIDFHIYTCWDSPGQSVPLTIGTIVRLYEPR